jgi:hypothetical protein
MRITSLRLHGRCCVISAGPCTRVGPLPVDYDRPLFDYTVVPYHNRARVPKDDNLWVHNSTWASETSAAEVNALLPLPWPIVTSPRSSTSAQVIDFE